jgi:hypothetical protein
MRIENRTARLLIGLAALLLTTSTLLAAEPDRKARLEDWQKKNPQWRALHMSAPRPDSLPKFQQLIADSLAPSGINVLILEIDYRFQFQSHPELEGEGMNKEQARELAETCHKCGIRLIPLLNCLGHQSARGGPSALLKKYPQFDETPEIPATSKTIYCREWCPSNAGVYPIVFDLFDELIDAFHADAFHVGMDEVFLIGSKNCPRCEGKNVAELFAGVVNRLHQHLVKEKGVEMLMWGDRLLKSPEYGSKWAASQTGSHPAIDMVPKDIIICDWHYPLQDDYPSVRLFQEKGFRVLPATYQYHDAALALIRSSHRDATDQMLGFLFTCWSGGGERLLQELGAKDTDTTDFLDAKPENSKRVTTRQLANTIRAGLKELAHPTEVPKPSPTNKAPAKETNVDGI